MPDPTTLVTMSTETCIAISQILPVLLVALIAEQVTVRVQRNGKANPRDLLAALARVFVDFVLAVALIIGLFIVLIGVEAKGLEGEDARSAWALTTFLVFAVVYRWFLLTPVVRYAITRGFSWYVRAVYLVLDKLTGWLTIFPDSLIRVFEAVFVIIAGALEFLIHVLTGGIEAFSDRIGRLATRSRRPTDESPDGEK